MNFFDTKAGQDFALLTIPRLVNAIEEFSKALKEQKASTKAPPPCSLCHVCVHFNHGAHYPGCRECASKCWVNFVHIDSQQTTG